MFILVPSNGLNLLFRDHNFHNLSRGLHGHHAWNLFPQHEGEEEMIFENKPLVSLIWPHPLGSEGGMVINLRFIFPLFILGMLQSKTNNNRPKACSFQKLKM